MGIKISDMNDLTPLEAGDLVEIARENGEGGYATGHVDLHKSFYIAGDDPDGVTAGSIRAAKEPSSSVAGNARGAGAVDLQQVRVTAGQVASANFATIGGGRHNTASGFGSMIGGGHNNTASSYYSMIGGGWSNTASGSSAMISGGEANTASGSYSTISGGWGNTASGSTSMISGGGDNTASGSYSVIGGGQNNTASEDYATILAGGRGVADRFGMEAYSAGRFSNNGDAQRVDFVARNKTTNDTPTTLFLNGSNARLAIPEGKILAATVNVAGIKSDGVTAAHFIRKVAIKNVGGTTSLIGAISAIGDDVKDDVGYDVTITADDANDALDIAVTGKTGETLRWVAHIEGVEIGYGS